MGRTPRHCGEFHLPGLAPDVCIAAFGEELVVHSSVLIAHSRCFRKALDIQRTRRPGDRDDSISHTFETVVWDYDRWELRRVDDRYTKRDAESGAVRFPNEISVRQAFRNLLRAFYGRRYTLEDITELEKVVYLAESLEALPALSASLEASLLGSPIVSRSIGPEAWKVLLLTYKTRSPFLFREAFIHAVGQKQSSRRDLEPEKFFDESLKCLVQRHHTKLREHVEAVRHDLYHMQRTRRAAKTEGEAVYLHVVDIVRARVRRALEFHRFDVELGNEARFYRSLYDAHFVPKPDSEADTSARPSAAPHYAKQMVEKCTGSLLDNNLTFGHAHFTAGKGTCDYFLCTTLDDSELPWDPEETSWY